MGDLKESGYFIEQTVNYTQEQILTKKISNRFRYNPKGIVKMKVRDKNGKQISKLLISYMHGGTFNLKRQTNKGKTEITLNMMANLTKTVDLILNEIQRVKEPNKHAMMKRMKAIKKK